MVKASALKICSEYSETERDETTLSILRQNNQNIVIDGKESKNDIPKGVENLAYDIMINDSIIRDFIGTLRENYITKKDDFCYSLAGKSDEEKNIIINIIKSLYGIIREYHYCQSCNMVSGKIVLSPKAHKFIFGQYMEIALYKKVKEILLTLSDKYNKRFDLYRNVRVSTKEDNILKNEFDLVIESSDGIVYVIEVKSGYSFRDFNKYTEIGKVYGIIPDRFLLVDNCLSSEDCDITQFFCEYMVSNLEGNNFSDKLVSMIENDI